MYRTVDDCSLDDTQSTESIVYRPSQNHVIFKEGESERDDEQFAFNDLGPRLDARAANDLRLANSKQMSTKFTAKTRYPLAPLWIRRRIRSE